LQERLDFSCALFDAVGNLIANAPHMPVHLGSMGESIKTVVRENAATMQPGDVTRTEADTDTTRAILDYSPSTTVEVGVGHFVDWYREYFRV
jgi:N-methylhydantoinase B/oxoprolinase/acetone carboxylase alpha subunit